jgi:hypothetical protein
MLIQPTEKALGSHAATPSPTDGSSPTDEAINDVHSLGTGFTAPRGEDPPSNGVAVMLEGNGNGATRNDGQSDLGHPRDERSGEHCLGAGAGSSLCR